MEKQQLAWVGVVLKTGLHCKPLTSGRCLPMIFWSFNCMHSSTVLGLSMNHTGCIFYLFHFYCSTAETNKNLAWEFSLRTSEENIFVSLSDQVCWPWQDLSQVKKNLYTSSTNAGWSVLASRFYQFCTTSTSFTSLYFTVGKFRWHMIERHERNRMHLEIESEL